MRKIIFAAILLSLSASTTVFAQNLSKNSGQKIEKNVHKDPDINVVLLSGEEVLKRNMSADQLSQYVAKIFDIYNKNFYSKNYTSSVGVEVTMTPTSQSFRLGNRGTLNNEEKISLNNILEQLNNLPKIKTKETVKFAVYFTFS